MKQANQRSKQDAGNWESGLMFMWLWAFLHFNPSLVGVSTKGAR